MSPESPKAPREKLDFRFLTTGSWIFGLIFCMLFAVLCHYLSQWQWDRRDQVVERITLVEGNYDNDPLEFAQDASPLTQYTPEDEWTPMRLHGEYLEDQTLVVRNRPRAGRPGYEVLVPFQTQDGTIVIVNRGWLPIGNAPGRPDVIPAPNPETDAVVGRVRPGEPALERDAPEGQVASVDLPHVAQLISDDLNPETIVVDAYLQMVSETPAADVTPQAQVEPTLDEGTHLSYAIQWYLFAIMGFGVWGYSAYSKARNERQDRIDGIHDDGTFAAHRPRRVRRRARRTPSDEEIEDALLDAEQADHAGAARR
ncbi:MAG: SURF1 family protein [Micrococcus sp.]|nr:SURF1 family protein [Micrococcus sp.]